MVRYKPVEYAQGQFIAISPEKQILSGSFEHAVNFVVDEKLDFSVIDEAHTNDNAGAPLGPTPPIRALKNDCYCWG